MSQETYKLRSIWASMRRRCYNAKSNEFHRYGGRGISVCVEWSDVNAFIKWALEHGYKKGLQIDRIDNNGNYEPENCRFVTARENSNNRSTNRRIHYKGNDLTLSEFSVLTGVKYDSVRRWSRNGLSAEQILETAKMKGSKCFQRYAI